MHTDKGLAEGPLICASSAKTNNTWLCSTKYRRLHLQESRDVKTAKPEQDKSKAPPK
jgi:hypothetical protein